MSSTRIKQRLQAALKLKGYGFLSLINSFREFDLNGDGELSWEEFNSALASIGLRPSLHDSRALFVELDTDGSNTITYDEFVASMKGELSQKRIAIIKRVFESIDDDHDGIISMTDIGSCLNAKNHPDVKSGRITVTAFLTVFFQSFEIVSRTGLITLEQFLQYYSNMAAFDDDASFENVMMSMWKVKAQNSAKKSLQDVAQARLTNPAEVAPGLDQIRKQLISRGVRGFVGLQRKFRLADEDRSGRLNLAEFKKIMRESSILVSDVQQNLLFNYFDKDKNGSININEFMESVQGEMSPRRRGLVQLAFKKLDKTGNGLVTPEDIINVYDASKHPDVIAGNKATHDVLREFLDTFDVGGEVDGKVTKQEFENYYTNLSASVDNDDYFELTIRNAWHISGGEGAAANSANRRVLVTRADGSQYVEEIKDDLGVKADDKAGMLGRLKQQGVSAAAVSVYDGIDNASTAVANRFVNGSSSNDTRIAIRGPLARSSDSSDDKLMKPNEMADPGVGYIINLLTKDLKSREGHGFILLQRQFSDFNGKVSMVDFKRVLKSLRLDLSDAQMRSLFEYFDVDHSGFIDYNEFMKGLRRPLSARRLRLVNAAFAKLDKNGDGLVNAAEIASTYNSSKHPEVLAGRETSDEVLRKFLDTFDVGGEVDGKVTQQEFENYYTNIGASIDNDDYFELMIRNAWHISGGEGAAANSANRRVLVTRADGSQYVEEIKDDLGISVDDKAGMLNRLKQQGAFASNISLFDGTEVGNEISKKQARKTLNALIKDNQPAQSNSSLESDVIPLRTVSPEELVALKGPRMSHKPATSVPKIAGIATTNNVAKNMDIFKCDTISPGIRLIMDKLKAELKARGCHGFIGLQRKFRIMDDDGSRSLSLGEFGKAMKEMNLGISNPEIRMLFDHFDTNKNGTIEFEEFVRAIQDPLSERRRQLVILAFSKLDRDGNGVVDAEEVAKAYDANRHPDVLSGAASPNEILQEFLDTFDVGGEVDGKVTKQEFENYYTNLSASIDNDDYFELMIRNAWHISGGEGAAANSANRRVLVTRADGSQYVEEIKDDLGVKADDKAGMLGRLKHQGVFASHLTTTGLTVVQEEAPRKGKRFSSNLGKSNAPVGVLPGTVTDTELEEGSKASLKALPAPPPSIGILKIIQSIKDELISRGSRGFIGLQRKFRIMDDDQSGSIDLGEFKKGIKEMKIPVSDPELRRVFEHFDTNRSGSIDFEEFLQGVRDPLNDRRRGLVQVAFAKLDKNNDGMIDIQEIANAYNATKHPEVLAGRQTPEQVFREFLDTFDVGGEVDGKVTKQEFENYYTNLSASIDNDDYFELMIRNAWHISGGEGAAANSANRRVLVTRADGSQYVEEIKDDLGVKADDKAGMLGRLKQQGVSASAISAYDGIENIEPVDPNALKPNFVPLNPKVSVAGIVKQQELRNAGLGSTKRRSSVTNATSLSGPVTDYGLALVIQKLKTELKSRGQTGFIGLQRKFRIMDDDNSKSIDMAEFKKAMKEMNLGLTDAEMRKIFEYFDVNKNNSIDFEEFIQGIRDPLNDRRLALVRQAFSKLDSDHSGVVECNDVIDKFDPSKHPEVIAKRKTPHQVLTEFLSNFDVGGEVDGKVTKQEFENYYTNLSASIDNDDYFELMIRNAWHISGGEGAAANSANRRVLVTRADGSQYVEEIKDDLGVKADDKAGMLGRLKQQGVSASAISRTDIIDNTIPSRKGRFSGVGPMHRSKIVFGDDRIQVAEGVDSAAKKGPGIQRATKNASSLGESMSQQVRFRGGSSVAKLIDEVRSALLLRGIRGFVSIQRRFKMMDDDNSGCASYPEFKKAMRECGVFITEEESKTIFNAFDTDNSGSLSFNELLQAIRGPINNRRKNIILQAFAKLDKDGNGIVDPDDIINVYDASKHPDVIAGKKTANEVLREFLDTFDVGGEVDGKVTKQEFENYYTNLSASIDNDDYFELMIRNAWHISGGEGAAANSANRRVLVTRADGSQYVEEIKDDLGVKADDKAGMLGRLKQQGVSAATVSWKDSIDQPNNAPVNLRNPIMGINVNTRRDTRRTSLGGGTTFKIA